MKYFLFYLSVLLIFLFFIFGKSQDYPLNSTIDKKQKGAHVFGRIDDSTDFQFLHRNNIEWVTLVPWASQSDYDSPSVRHHRGDSLQILRRDSSWLSRLELAHAAGFKVFVKPHVWIGAPSAGKWRSDIFPSTEENWKLWKTSYTDFILRYARIAEQAHAEMFCVGTEFTRLVIEKPVYWKELIQKVRNIYTGKITYAANWYKEYEQLTFWEDLDYIGIQAYFPLVENENPSVEQISKGWNKYLPTLESMHKKHNRQIIFTEMGYKSTSDSAMRPWEWIDYAEENDKTLSYETQANCYEAFFNTIWTKEWLKGVHLWQLRSDYKEDFSPRNDLDFTPFGKPVEEVIARGFE